jgi:hypothetical protein
MEQSFNTAVRAFAETLQQLDVEVIPVEAQRALGRRAALLAAAMYEWRQQVGATFTSRQVQDLLGIKTRQGVHDLLKRERLLGLDGLSGQRVYPAFQFNERGRPYAVLPAVLAHFAEADVSPHTIASWFTSPQALLEGQTPAAWLKRGDPPDQVVEAARRSAARLGR